MTNRFDLTRRLAIAAAAAALVTATLSRAAPAAEGERATGLRYVADLDAVRNLWPSGPPIDSVEDLFRVELVVGEHQVIAATHLFGDRLDIIPYHNSDGVTDASGAEVERGDGVLARYFPPGAVGFAVKHRRPAHRRLVVGRGGLAVLKEELKLRDTHVEVLVGVERLGRPGVITLNSPQTYEGGRFGTAGYPMIFLEPVLPPYLPAERHSAFVDNLRTMLLGFNAVSKFPLRYYGGDPLAARTPESVRAHAAMMVRAIAGDSDARQWFRDDEQLLYCGELAHLGTSAGLLVPLNRRTLEPLVGERWWKEFVRQLEAHNRGQSSAFTELNENRFAALVTATLAPEDLAPAISYAPDEQRPELAQRLAFRPMTATDMLELFMRVHVPRQELGESLAPLAGALLRELEPTLMELYRIGELEPGDPKRPAVERLSTQIREVVSTPHQSYGQFRAEVEPLLDELRLFTDPEIGSGQGWYLPPSLFHVTASGLWSGGLVDLRYVGHGLHYSLVTARPADRAGRRE